MLNVVVLVSGGGTNLQAIIDAVNPVRLLIQRLQESSATIKMPMRWSVRKSMGFRTSAFLRRIMRRVRHSTEFLKAVDELQPDLIVLAGFLVVIPAEMIAKYRNRMINIHPSLIPSFCGTGFYGLKVHEEALERGV
ncbi:MAG: formyltransferase family protein [Dorea sp.]